MNRIRSRQMEEEIWAKHYSSNHQILLVGEGDFSFALSLALSFGSASNIVGSSLDSYENQPSPDGLPGKALGPLRGGPGFESHGGFNQGWPGGSPESATGIPVRPPTSEPKARLLPDVVIKKYKSAKTNLKLLAGLGAQLLHGVDAITMKFCTDLQVRKFDRVVYNFPHAGFLGKENEPWVIMMHRKLVHGFFRNASGMLHPSGEVHVTHKTTFPFDYWNIEELATQSCFTLLERVEFKLEDYPGYENKRGDGSRSDEPFPLGECSTFKFVLSSTATTSNPRNRQEILLRRANVSMVMNRSECFRIFSEYFNHARKMNGQDEYLLFYSVSDKLRLGFERYKAENRGRPLNGYVNLLEDLRSLSKQRILFLQNQLLEIDQQHGL